MYNTYRKLSEILYWDAINGSIEMVRNIILNDLDYACDQGTKEGKGDVIVSWDLQSWQYIRLPHFNTLD
jgi:putative aminopeptidase FrvX